MSRFKVLRANPRRALAALATVLVAVGVTAASGANFNAQSANAGNTFSSGTLTMSNDKAGGAILSASNMKPATRHRHGRHQEHRHAGRHVHAQQGHARPTPTRTYKMSTQLNLVVTDCGVDKDCDTATTSRTPVYSGTLAAMGTGIVARHLRPAARSTATSSPRRSTPPRRRQLPGRAARRPSSSGTPRPSS